jgi:pilus assembly protein CpaB
MKQKNLILMVVAVGCGLVAAFLTTQINARPKVEQVEVIVAAKDLAVGTMMTKADLPKLITRKKMAKDALPAAFVITEDELLDRRLTRSVLKDETFNPGVLTKGSVITLPEGMDMISMPVSVSTAVAGFVGPGSKVDVLATIRLTNQLRAFPLLVDMLVLAVDQHVSYDTAKNGGGVFPNMSNVSFAATQEQALLLALAKQRGCHLELLLRHPGKKMDPDYDIKKIKQMLEDQKNPALLKKTEEGFDPSSEEPVLPSTVAPAPQPRAEMVKVWMAKVNLEPGTEITKDLVENKLVESEIPKVAAKGAYSDLSDLIKQNLTLKTGLSEGQWVTSSLVGPPASKVKPQDDWQPPKAKQDVPSDAPRKTKDVVVHSPSGTFIHRFEEIRPGEWRLKTILTPAEAARRSAQAPPPAAPDSRKDDARKDGSK